ncbi:unnamed protein product [Gadus morhua 'NCC']
MLAVQVTFKLRMIGEDMSMPRAIKTSNSLSNTDDYVKGSNKDFISWRWGVGGWGGGWGGLKGEKRKKNRKGERKVALCEVLTARVTTHSETARPGRSTCQASTYSGEPLTHLVLHCLRGDGERERDGGGRDGGGWGGAGGAALALLLLRALDGTAPSRVYACR